LSQCTEHALTLGQAFVRKRMAAPDPDVSHETALLRSAATRRGPDLEGNVKSVQRLLILGLLPAILLLGAACDGGDSDDGDDGGSSPTAEATSESTTEATSEATTEATTAATEEPTEEPAASVFAAVDGVTCTGAWENLTFGSTGSFEVVFAVNEAGDGGTATLTLGGNVFGQTGGTVELPFMLSGGQVVAAGQSDLFGNTTLTFNEDGTLVSGVLDSPTALGAGSTVTLDDFAFDGSALTATVAIETASFSAESAVETTCG
jgi:hypothetical protein